jgi:hypothetical protein
MRVHVLMAHFDDHESVLAGVFTTEEKAWDATVLHADRLTHFPRCTVISYELDMFMIDEHGRG